MPRGLVYQHLAAWCSVQQDATLSTWRTTGGLEVDFVVDMPDGLLAIDVKTGAALRPADRRGLLAFHEEFPEAHLVALTDGPMPSRRGPIREEPLGAFLQRVVPGQPLI